MKRFGAGIHQRGAVLGLLLGVVMVAGIAQSDQTASWNVDADGNWSNNGNWNPSAATGTTSVAYFNNAITAPRTVTVDASPWVVNSLLFTNNSAGNAYGWTITGGALSLGGTVTVNGKAGTATVASAVTSATLIKAGSGKLVLSGATTNTAWMALTAGVLSLTGSLTNSAELNLNGTGNPVLEVSGTLSANKLWVGNGNGVVGAVYQNGGTNTVRSGASVDHFVIGANNGFGYYRLNSGALNFSEVGVASAFGGHGVLDVLGGSFTPTSWLTISRGNNQTAVVNISGGSMNAPSVGTGNVIGLNWGTNDTSIVTLSGTGLIDAANGGIARAFNINVYAASNNTGVINLNGGTLLANGFSANATGTSRINFNGGLLKAATNTTMAGTFLTGLSAAYVYSGGAVIDDNTQNIAVGQALLAPGGNGVSSIAVSGGTGYIAPPIVQITGGGGTGATAVAPIDANGNLTGITITSLGNNYTGTPTVTLVGGGGSGASIGAVVTAPVVSGGLTKLGAGTLTLNGVNTYTGTTTISNGTLKCGIAKALPVTAAVAVAGGTYDLGGFTVTNDMVMLSAGSIANGTLQANAVDISATGFLPRLLVGADLLIGTSLTKSGPGALTIGPTQASTGVTKVSGGVLKVLGAPPADPLVRYTFDTASISGTTVTNFGLGGAADNGVISGSPVIGASGKLGQAITMTNNACGVATANAVTLTNAVTLATWVKSSGAYNLYQRIIHNNYGASVYLGTDPNNKFLMVIKNTFVYTSISSTDTKNWHHIAMTWDGSRGVFYYDGLAVTNVTLASTDISYTGKFGFGHNVPAGNGEYWNGSMDESYIYGRALSAGEIQALAGNPGASLLPSTAVVQVDAGATLDLGGSTSQQVAGLVGSGSVSNGTLKVTGAVEPGGTNTLGTLTVQGNLVLAANALLNYDFGSISADGVQISGSLTLQGANTVHLKAIGVTQPPKILTLFTFGSPLVGGANLSNWTVEGEGLEAYTIRVKTEVNSLYLSITRKGTMIRIF